MIKTAKNNSLNYIARKFNIDAHYFFHGGFWLSTGQAVTILFGLITTALFAHFLTEAEFGLYKYLIGISVILSSFSLTGIGQAILQTTAKGYPGFYRETIKINFLYSLGIVVAGLAGAIYYWYNQNEVLAMGCLLVALLQPFISTLQNIPSLLQGSKKFRENTNLHIARMFGVTLISIATLFIFESILVLFFFYLASNLFVLVASNFLYRPKKQEVPEHIYSQYLSYAKHTSFRNIISNIAQRADTIIVFTQLGAVELAIYSIALIIPEQIKGSFKNLASLLMPKYAKYKDEKILRTSIKKRSYQLAVILFTVTTFYIFLCPYIYGIIFPKYSEAILLSQILALSFPAMVAILPTSFMEATIKNKDLYIFNILISISTLFFTYVGVIYGGLWGAFLAKVIQRYITSVLMYYLFFKSKN